MCSEGATGMLFRGPSIQELPPPPELLSILKEIEFKQTMLSISIVEATTQSCGCKVVGICCSGTKMVDTGGGRNHQGEELPLG